MKAARSIWTEDTRPLVLSFHRVEDTMKKLRPLTQADKDDMRQKRQAAFDKMTPAEKERERARSEWIPIRPNY
jgi:hypothetical protein